jgi:hypothetical protein
MATKKTTTKTTKSSNSGWGLNKISFYVLGAMAVLYILTTVLALLGVNFKVVSVLQGLATAVAICIIAYIAWKYVAHKATVWKVLYVVFLLLVIAGIIIPLIK